MPLLMPRRLVKTTQEALYLAIDMVKPGIRLGDIGMQFSNMPKKDIILWSESIVAMASAEFSMKSPRFCIMEPQYRAGTSSRYDIYHRAND